VVWVVWVDQLVLQGRLTSGDLIAEADFTPKMQPKSP
jgi:hypothetical protein